VITTVDRERLAALVEREADVFASAHPRSGELYRAARQHLLDGVPMAWMREWHGPFPLHFAAAKGSRITDVDGHEYVDFCLGDTAAMAGHAPDATAAAVAARYRRGTTAMLPTEDATWVAAELSRRFGDRLWQFALSATDANRWVLRMARHVTGRSRILVFNHNYHGTVDEVNLIIDAAGRVRTRTNNLGAPIDPAHTTKVVEFNDPEALIAALEPRDVACVIAEAALTNIGIVPPRPGFHELLREVTRATGTLLIIDETHMFSAGPGGGTRLYGLDPDAVTLGKAIAGGIPIGAYGLAPDFAERMAASPVEAEDTGMIGGTLAGNALSMAAARATLEQVLTDDAFASMVDTATYYADSVRHVIDDHELPWHIVQVGARVEYRFRPETPRTGAESAAARDDLLDAYLHLRLIDHGVLITPFHNMALMAPTTTKHDVDRHTEAFASAVADLRVA
jgi:glutamate-1-semialdehyde 2,1-aminomutase